MCRTKRTFIWKNLKEVVHTHLLSHTLQVLIGLVLLGVIKKERKHTRQLPPGQTHNTHCVYGDELKHTHTHINDLYLQFIFCLPTLVTVYGHQRDYSYNLVIVKVSGVSISKTESRKF